MEKFYEKVLKHRKWILLSFLILTVFCGIIQQFVSVNYDMNDYLPEDSPSTVSLDVMEQEFDGSIPNARVMIRDVTIPEALEYKDKLLAIDGVSEVTWLDDAVNIKQPLEMQDAEQIETYYKDNAALYTVTIEEDAILSAVFEIRELIGDNNAMAGNAVSTAMATESTVEEVRTIAIFAVIFVLFLLLLTTTSYVEPFIVLGGLGVAILINGGTNLIFGEISFVTNAAGSILQLAVSLDYSVFLIHRFSEFRSQYEDPQEAMKHALCKSTSSILSSGLTTVIGFLALCFMRFKIGPDLGLALAKGVAISLVTVFFFMPGLILSSYKWMDKTSHRNFMPSFRGLGKFIVKLTLPFVFVFLLLVVPSYLASGNNSYYYGSSHIFGPDTQLGQDTEAIDEVFGKSDTYVLLVPKGNTALETQLSEELNKLPEITSIISYVDLVGREIPYEYLDEDTLAMLESEHYSRMVISADTEEEGNQTFCLIETIRDLADKYYPNSYYLAGAGVSTYDLMDTVTTDMLKVNALAIGAVFLVLLLTLRSGFLALVLVLTIETAIWFNLSLPYYMEQPLFYIAYLIISSVQLGATVDYAILFTDRYRENRQALGKRDSVVETISNVTVSILTSGSALTIVGFLLGIFSTHGLLSQLGYLLGKGTLCSLVCVLFVLPGTLCITDKLFQKRAEIKAELKKNEGV